jgi:hypothetical protein
MMATWGSDTAYTMFSRLSPLRAAPRAIDHRLVDRRWDRWLPWCVQSARATADPANELFRLRELHAERFTALLHASVSMRAITAGDLDDPRWTGDFTARLAEAVERRRVRMGRVAGRGGRPNQRAEKEARRRRRRERERTKENK